MAWAGCSHRSGWSSVPWRALAKVRAGAGADHLPRVDLASSCARCVSRGTRDGFGKTFPLPGVFGQRWPGESEPRIDLRRELLQVSFWLAGASAPTGHSLPAGCPRSALAPCQECVCWAGWGNCHPKKRKSCLLVLPASDPLPFQSLGKAGLKVMSFCRLALGQ